MTTNKRIYLDYAAATPLDDRVKQAMDPFMSVIFANPSSLHAQGKQAAQAIADARTEIASLLTARPQELIFTGSGTESCNLAIQGVCRAREKQGKHLIVTAAEHHAVLEAARDLERRGWELTIVPVDKYGLVDAKRLAGAVRPVTVLVSVIWANNEVGSINDIQLLGKAVKKKNPATLFHTDACQAAGFLPLSVASSGIDLMTLNAAKIYGPKGIGLLYKKTGVMLEPLIHGGGQEQGFRSGTQDTAAIVGFAVALRLAEQQREAETKRLAALRDSFIASLKSAVNGLRLNGDPSRRLPNNVNVSIDGVDGEALVVYLDQHGIAASTGAACVAHRSEPSHVLLAMGVSAEQAKESIRFTFGRSTTRDGLEKVVAVLPSLIDKLRVEETLNADR